MESSIIPFSSLFFIKNENNLIISLRTILSTFLLENHIYPLEKIFLEKIETDNKFNKIIEFIYDSNLDQHYLEHPTQSKILFQKEKDNNNIWNRSAWFEWLQSIIKKTKNYHKLNKVLQKYLKKEIDNVFELSICDLDYLCRNVKDLEADMINPFMHLYYYLDIDNKNKLPNILKGHIDALIILFSQIINKTKRKQIVIEIFQAAKVFSCYGKNKIEDILKDETLLQYSVLNFKQEVNRIVNKYTLYVDTLSINFKNWFLSISSFLFYCKPVQFDLKHSISKINLILFFLDYDELLENDLTIKCIQYINIEKTKKSSKILKKKSLNKLIEHHPFLRASIKL